MSNNNEISLEDLLDEYDESIERGEQPDISSICKKAPELETKFRRKVEILQKSTSFLQNPAPADSVEETLRVSSELKQLRFHAKGGLGAVYKARDGLVHRDVAIKFIHPALVNDPDSCARFELEAEVTGRLEHPGIVPLYGVGKADNGRLFYYMRFIDGENLDELIARFHKNRPSRGKYAEQSIEFQRLLTCFVSVCNTVAYAHNRGIVHRDLKPANIMIGKFGETLVVDWGLAVPVNRGKRFRDSGEASLRPSKGSGSTGNGIGTVAYMSPEQASGLAPAPASDIYSLGATLYKILTGEPSVSGQNHTTLKERVITGDFPSPKDRLASVPEPLDAICLMAMSLHPKDRYETALDLAADVEGYLADSEVKAYEEPFSRRVFRMARKNIVATQAIVFALLAITAIMAMTSVWSSVASRESQLARDQAVGEKLKADAARKKNLITSAKYLADSVAHQIDKRWRVLEDARNSPRLIELVKQLNLNSDDDELLDELQRWLLETRSERNVFEDQSSRWMVFGFNGEFLSSSPRVRLDGKQTTFHYRDYFHAFGRDFEKDDLVSLPAGVSLEDLRPHHFLLNEGRLAEQHWIHSAHVSNVFEGKASKHLQVSFSVPIWDRPSENRSKVAIGLFTISMELQDFILPQNAMLVQLDKKKHVPGMIISHPLLQPHDNSNLPPNIGALVKKAQILRRLRARDQTVADEEHSFVKDFIDPLGSLEDSDAPPKYAAFEPVLVNSRPNPIRDTGWLVIVTETNTSR